MNNIFDINKSALLYAASAIDIIKDICKPTLLDL